MGAQEQTEGRGAFREEGLGGCEPGALWPQMTSQHTVFLISWTCTYSPRNPRGTAGHAPPFHSSAPLPNDSLELRPSSPSDGCPQALAPEWGEAGGSVEHPKTPGSTVRWFWCVREVCVRGVGGQACGPYPCPRHPYPSPPWVLDFHPLPPTPPWGLTTGFSMGRAWR